MQIVDFYHAMEHAALVLDALLGKHARCKQSGMRWSKPGAQNVLVLRCIHSGDRLEFWKHRLNTLAALNDPLALAA